MMEQRILHIFTRTPLHVGAGSSVGAVDQPVQRERHTGFPIIPGSGLKGAFADAWSDGLLAEDDQRVRVKKDGEAAETAWLFGSDSDKNPAAGSLQFSGARLLAFPIRSARGSFAWITSPLILARAVRDGVFSNAVVPEFPRPSTDLGGDIDNKAFFAEAGPLNLDGKIVLEEYTFEKVGGDEATEVGNALAKIFPEDQVWASVRERLVIISDGMMSFFAENACEIAQHVKIDDETGTAADGALFNQENVPSETMFYCTLNGFAGRMNGFKQKTAREALEAFANKLEELGAIFQFGGDASTGLGFCSVTLGSKEEAAQ